MIPHLPGPIGQRRVTDIVAVWRRITHLTSWIAAIPPDKFLT